MYSSQVMVRLTLSNACMFKTQLHFYECILKCSSEWSGPCYLQCLAQVFVYSVCHQTSYLLVDLED